MDKKDKILIKVCKMFRKYGIKSVTMDDIAHELSISKKTLYTHFKDKTELVKKSVKFISDSSYHSSMEQEFKQLKNAVEQLIYIYVTGYKLADEYNFSYEYDLKKYYPDIYSEYRKKRRDKIYSGIYNNLKQGISEGYFNNDFNPEIIALIHTSKIECINDNSIIRDSKFDLKEIFKQMFYYHLRAISTSKGINFFNEKIKNLDNYYKL